MDILSEKQENMDVAKKRETLKENLNLFWEQHKTML